MPPALLGRNPCTLLIFHLILKSHDMTGESNLDTLLATMAPQLAPERVVFCSLPAGTAYDHLSPLAMIRELEGTSLVITEASARQHGIAYANTYQGITLTVHSSLDAVGLTAAVSTRLADAGISANMVAGYYHDHVFHPE